MRERDDEAGPGECSADGVVREVVYVGAATRFIVELDLGTRLVVMEQNRHRSSMDALAIQGRSVRLVWKREHSRTIALSGGSE